MPNGWSRNRQVLRDIWNDSFPPGRPRPHSLIEKLAATAVVLLSFLSLTNLPSFSGKPKSADVMDRYVLAWVALLTAVLWISPHVPDWVQGIFVGLASYRIVDTVSYRLYFLVVKSQVEPWRLDRLRRSVTIAIVNLYEVVTAFAVIYACIALVGVSGGAPSELPPITSFYYSLVTMLTVGYGDFVPVTDLGRVVASAQLAAIGCFVIVLMPALVSLLTPVLARQSGDEPKSGEGG